MRYYKVSSDFVYLCEMHALSHKSYYNDLSEKEKNELTAEFLKSTENFPAWEYLSDSMYADYCESNLKHIVSNNCDPFNYLKCVKELIVECLESVVSEHFEFFTAKAAYYITLVNKKPTENDVEIYLDNLSRISSLPTF